MVITGRPGWEDEGARGRAEEGSSFGMQRPRCIGCGLARYRIPRRGDRISLVVLAPNARLSPLLTQMPEDGA